MMGPSKQVHRADKAEIISGCSLTKATCSGSSCCDCGHALGTAMKLAIVTWFNTPGGKPVTHSQSMSSFNIYHRPGAQHVTRLHDSQSSLWSRRPSSTKEPYGDMGAAADPPEPYIPRNSRAFLVASSRLREGPLRELLAPWGETGWMQYSQERGSDHIPAHMPANEHAQLQSPTP